MLSPTGLWTSHQSGTTGVDVKTPVVTMITERERYREGRAPHMAGKCLQQCLRVTQKLSSSQGVRERNTSYICLMELSGQLVTLSVRHLYPTIEYSPHIWTYNKAQSMPLRRLDNKMKVSPGSEV